MGEEKAVAYSYYLSQTKCIYFTLNPPKCLLYIIIHLLYLKRRQPLRGGSNRSPYTIYRISVKVGPNGCSFIFVERTASVSIKGA